MDQAAEVANGILRLLHSAANKLLGIMGQVKLAIPLSDPDPTLCRRILFCRHTCSEGIPSIL
jgi:hypothetical protein